MTAAICIAPVIDSARSIVNAGGRTNLLRLMAAGVRDGIRARRHAEPYRIPVVGPPGSLAVLPGSEGVQGVAAMTPPDSTWRNEVCARVDSAYHLTKEAQKTSCPTLYCIAEDDGINPPELGKEAAEAAPDGELRLYPGTHFAPSEDEAVFERMVADQLEFLDRRL